MVPDLQNESSFSVFDVCDTLYYSNTTHDFVEYTVARRSKGIRYALYRFLNFRPVQIVLVVLAKVLKVDPIRSYNISMLAGMTRSDLNAEADQFVADVLRNREVLPVRQLIKERRAKNDEIILCSSSIEPVVRAVAKEIGVDHWIATTLHFTDDRFTGKIENDPTGRKLETLNAAGFRNIEFAVSDNRSDEPLLRSARSCFAVTHARRHADHWERIGLPVLDVKK